MKILLIGECYSSNIGDQLVAISTQFIVSKIYPNATFYKLDIAGRNFVQNKDTANQDNNTFTLKFKLRVFFSNLALIDFLLKKRSASLLKNHYKKIISESNPSLAIFCGGQLINDTFVCQIQAISKILLKKNIPTIYNGIGIGKLNSWQCCIFRKILNFSNVKLISCRSDINRFIQNLKLDNVIESFDPAIFASDVYKIKRYKESGVIGLGVMDSTRFPKTMLIDFWISIINILNSKNIRWKLFYTGSINDYYLAVEVLEKIGVNNKEKFIKEDITLPEDCVKEIVQFDKIISFRLHSHILAYSFGIPSIAISWDNKINDFFYKIGRPECVFNLGSNQRDIIDALLLANKYNSENLETNKKNILNLFNRNIL